MKISANGLALIKAFEGCYLTAYQDPVGVWTIGWGTTGAEAKPGRKITAAQAEEFLRRDLETFEEHVDSLAKVPLAQYEFDALVSWSYNTGGPSTATLWKVLNVGNKAAVPAELERWNKAGGHVLAGLTRRRKAEGQLFAGDIAGAFKTAGIPTAPQAVASPRPAPISAPQPPHAPQETAGMGKYNKAIGATVGAATAWLGAFGITSLFGLDIGHVFDVVLPVLGSVLGTVAAPANK